MENIKTKKLNTGNWQYNVFYEKIFNADFGEYITYGIMADNSIQTLAIHDVSPLRETVSHMTGVFNRCGLSPIHFREAVEDMIG